MWNRNSRRWLVKGSERDNSGRTLPSLPPPTAPPVAITNTPAPQDRLAPPPSSSSSSGSRQTSVLTCMSSSQQHCRLAVGAGRRRHAKSVVIAAAYSLPPLYQIIEVLVALILANCCAHALLVALPTAAAAFGANMNAASPPAYLFDANGAVVGSRHAYAYLQHQQQQQPDIDASALNQLQRSQHFKISPKPCSIGRIEGTCMFVWECIKSEGRHVGMCVDSFMFGSCCAHNYTENIVMPPSFSYTRPTKPVGISSLNHRPRPPPHPHRPSISGMTTIERPHGAGTLVIRPSGPHHQGVLPHRYPSKRPTTTAPSTPTAVTAWSSSNSVFGDMQTASSISSPLHSAPSSSTNMWHSGASAATPQQHWHMTTEPNFITKPRPPSWEKPTPQRQKPAKPTKRPPMTSYQPLPDRPSTAASRPTTSSTAKTTVKATTAQPTALQHQQQHVHQQDQHQQPARPPTTALLHYPPAYTRPTPSWISPSSSSSSSIITTISTTTTRTTPKTTIGSSSTTTTTTSTAAQKPHNKPTVSESSSSGRPSTTHRPLATKPALISSSTAGLATSGTIESNEIADTSAEGLGPLATIKTVSAARSECGMPVLTRPETRIVGGKSAPFGRWPWQVSVRRTSFFGFSSTHRCGGALINENWIATAGHCVDDLLISQIRIRVGEYDFSHVQEQLPYIERGVAKKVVHPKYNFYTYEYDLALVKLEQPLEFAPHVSPICLPQTDSLLIGMNATVTGWGRLSEGGTLPSVLQEVSVPIVSNDNCKTMFLRAGRQEFIPDIFLCAGYETGGQDSCQGDSGGPLQVKSLDGRYFLAGIISWGIGCAEANLPGVCTRISKFVPWIMENVT